MKNLELPLGSNGQDLHLYSRSRTSRPTFKSTTELMSSITELNLQEFSSSRQLDLLFLRKMTHLKVLEIYYCVSLEEFILGKENTILKILNQYYFQSLRVLVVRECFKLKHLTWLAFAPNIEEIYIGNCYGMKELIGEWKWEEDADQEGGRPIISFAKLRYLELSCLPQLERICPTALPFPCLKLMEVKGRCLNLKKLPFNSSSCNSGCGITIEGKEEWWNGLEWEDEATRLAFLPCFKPFPKLKNES